MGQAKPTVNEQSWTNLSSVLWVEQPVGTGFSQGIPNAQNEDDVAAQLVGFMQQFLEVFSELKGKKLYLTGESVHFYLNSFIHHAHLTYQVRWNIRALSVKRRLYEMCLKYHQRYCELYLRESLSARHLVARDMDQRS